MAERVVDIVEAWVRRLAGAERAQKPELLVVADVRQVPRERRHQLRVLCEEPRVADGFEEGERSGPRGFELAGDVLVLVRHRS